MGTWNATCAVTQLPIVENRPVVMIPLVCMPPDHLARDSIGGSGSTSNTILAQPLSLPLRGTYDGGGGIERSKDDVGQAYLAATLRGYVETKRLYKLKSAEPVLCRNLPRDFMELLSTGDLLIMTPNPRKEWLQALRKVYDEAEDKAGLSHYEAQLKVDPNTLPDMLPMPLAINFVSTTLYDALTQKVGAGESYDQWNEEEGKFETFKGNRAAQLDAELTLKPAVKKKIDLALAAFDRDAAAILDSKEKSPSNEMKELVLLLYTRKAAEPVFKRAQEIYFSPHGAQYALKDALMHNNTAVRNELAGFDMFTSAMARMRKQWVPQAGAGNSNALEDDATRELYALTGQFIDSSCGLAEPDGPSV